MIQLGYRGKIAVVLVGLSFSLNQLAYGQNLPKGEELLDKYVAVTGGKEAYEKCKNRLIKGTMEFAGASEDIARIVHGHPTLSEVVKEAALAVDKRTLNM